MLGEGFLRILRYREERRFASRQQKAQTHSHCTDPRNCSHNDPHSADLQTGLNQEDLDSTLPKGLKEMPQAPAGLSIPGCTPDFTLCVDDCSLLEQYPDLQVADSGLISNNPQRATTAQQGFDSLVSETQRPVWTVQQKSQDEPVSPMPDQGYLVMGPSENISLDLPGSGLEPMSNSVLNGLLDKKLEEFWMQHLTENLARCNSHLENSLLHGLAQPPQPCSDQEGTDSLEPSLGEGYEDSNEKISYLSTHNLVPCSSNFSSPVLRISEANNSYLQ